MRKIFLLTLCIVFLSCTNHNNSKTSVIPTNDANKTENEQLADPSNNTNKTESEQLADPLILGGKPYVDFHGKAYRKDEAELFTSLVCDFNPNAVVRWYSFEGIEQLVNLRYLSVDGENLDTVDFAPLSSLSNLEGLYIHGNITRLPDLTKLEKLRDITIENTYLKSLEGIGAPNIRWIEINNGAGLNSLAPLNNLPQLEFLTIISRGSTTLRIADISNLPNLKNLRLLMPFTRIDLQGIENMPMLGELWITESESFNIEGIGKLGNLWRLFLKLVSPQPSVEFLRGMPNLSELSLFGDIEFLDIYPIQSTEPYQTLDFSPLATIKNLRRLGCTGFIIKNIAALDVLDALSIRDDESPGYIYLAGSRLYDETEKSRHPLVLEHPVRE